MIPVLIAAIADSRARRPGRHRATGRPGEHRSYHSWTPAGSEETFRGVVPTGADPAGLIDAPTAAAAIAGGRGATEKDAS